MGITTHFQLRSNKAHSLGFSVSNWDYYHRVLMGVPKSQLTTKFWVKSQLTTIILDRSQLNTNCFDKSQLTTSSFSQLTTNFWLKSQLTINPIRTLTARQIKRLIPM